MPTRTFPSPWYDRFSKPQGTDLITSLPEETQKLAEEIRNRFSSLPGVSEQVEWMGLPWRWTLVYSTPSHPSQRALAYLVPDPESVRISIPLEQSMLHLVTGSKASKTLRESMAQSSRVGGMIWPEWAFGPASLVEELPAIAQAKLAADPALSMADAGA